MRLSAMLLRSYLPQEFVYLKRVKYGTANHLSVMAAAHVFEQLPSATQKRIHDESSYGINKVVVVPIFDYAFPSFWTTTMHVLLEERVESVFVEGYSGDYMKKQYRQKGHKMPAFYERWRNQRVPWPWPLPHPVVIHGGDTETWTTLQRLFPHQRPKPSDEERRAKMKLLVPRMQNLCGLYRSTNAGTMFHYRYAPLLAQELEESGYKLTNKLEIEAASTVNERYDTTMQYLKHEMESVVNA
ncbi:hypothetical protein DIPPA_51237 [Diplonema papillatum]|nr:hypothetical protein DIPPA_51237 [Diplonema papillatum]